MIYPFGYLRHRQLLQLRLKCVQQNPNAQEPLNRISFHINGIATGGEE